MEDAALCIRLSVTVLILMAPVDCYSAQETGAASLRISPDRLQFYEYEAFTVNCEADAGAKWRVKTDPTASADSSPCNASAPSCSIDPALYKHSGQYWCEDEEGQRSRAVGIAVTPGSVILEMSARPVVQGHDVKLHCRNKRTESQQTVDFYRNKSRLETSYNNNVLTITNVSTSDEGFYGCSISGVGDSPQSWLAVMNQPKAHAEPRPSNNHLPPLNLLQLLCVVVAVLLVDLLLLVMGVLVTRKHREPEVSSTKLCLPGSGICTHVNYR